MNKIDAFEKFEPNIFNKIPLDVGESINTRSCSDLNKPTKSFDILDVHIDHQKQGVFKQSVINELVSLRDRHMVRQLTKVSGQYLDTLQGLVDGMVCAINQDYVYKSCTFDEVLEGKVGPLRKRYAKALDNVQKGKVIDTRISSFIKIEKFTQDKLYEKPPRLIQHRSYEYLALLTKFLKPIDNYIKNSKVIFLGQEIGSIIGRGKDMTTLATQVYNLSKEYLEPVFICLDHTSWDAHVTSNLLKLEHKFYNKLAKNRWLRALLKKQLNNYGRTMNGVVYKTKGRRMSGEYNTSLGNTLINYWIIKSVCILCGISNSSIVCNGDDSILILERKDYKSFDLNLFKFFNQETKLEKVTSIFEEVEFCQCQPVLAKGIYRFVRKPERVISRSTCMTEDFSKCVKRYFMSIGLCELALNRGIPILQAFSLRLIQLADGNRPLDSVRDFKAKFEPDLQILPIDFKTRESFSRAFGYTIEQQLYLEKILGPDKNLARSKEISSSKAILKYKNYHNG